MKQIVVFMLGCLLLNGCSKDTPTAPTPTPTVAPPSITENWGGTLAVGGTRFYSFSVTQNGTVNVTLTSLIEGGVDSTTQLLIALGFPAGTGCTAAASVTMAAGAEPQLTNTLAPGVYCARISDPGNLSGPAVFRMVIAHP